MYKQNHFIQNKNGDNMKIETIMTSDMIIASIDDTIETLSMLMKKYDIGFLPLALKNKIVGVITDRDITLALSNHLDSTSTMESYMTKELVTVSIYNKLEEALDLMAKYKVKRLLVTNHKKVVGILSLSDIIHSNINTEMFCNALKQIWTIYRNINTFDTEIDEFYL